MQPTGGELLYVDEPFSLRNRHLVYVHVLAGCEAFDDLGTYLRTNIMPTSMFGLADCSGTQTQGSLSQHADGRCNSLARTLRAAKKSAPGAQPKEFESKKAGI